jgi:hypothetical protein
LTEQQETSKESDNPEVVSSSPAPSQSHIRKQNKTVVTRRRNRVLPDSGRERRSRAPSPEETPLLFKPKLWKDF